ncbi:hypothetical protein [Pseudorhodoplanes sinuspersici]|uniref:hypothetical protein n=1 Tax=Pseudorhodoplanes sinuspersici TaxID=1235591 RepID=UPI0012FD4AFE|nr:hypothetical protein [Pseudorhodoplanes sinuspersici]
MFKRPAPIPGEPGEYRKRQKVDEISQHADFLENRAKPFAEGKIDQSKTHTDNAHINAPIVTFVLQPGEAFELDCWTVPSEKMLTQCFYLPETLAIRALERSRAATGSASVAMKRASLHRARPAQDGRGHRCRERRDRAPTHGNLRLVDDEGSGALHEGRAV